MPASKAQQKAVSKYMKENYDEIKIRMGKGKKETIQATAAAVGESVNAYINAAITLRMGQDSGGTPPTGPQEPAGQPAGAGGIISLSPDTLKAAQAAAEAAGEAVGDFMARAVEAQAQRDKASLKLGINPATGDKLEQGGKGGASHE